jgi:hypothetical protein
MSDTGMPMPAASDLMPMPSYGSYTVLVTEILNCALQQKDESNKLIAGPT